MKKSLKLSVLAFAVFLMPTINIAAQIDLFAFGNELNAGEIHKNDEMNPCITSMEYSLIESRCAENIKALNIDNSQRKQLSTTTLNWPLKTSTGFKDCSYYFIGAYVDQNTASGAFKDWNCGTRSYDGHGGTDIGIWPFPINKVDSNVVCVVAAAAGTIIDKHDGEFDRNCVGSGSGLQANYVIIQHADGSMALYWHMKKNSLTTKSIGQTVVVGEQIGVVASSGSSSGPHLHFEIWAGKTASTRIDPYYGTCNVLNTSTWWASQKPALEPSILKASVHITDFVAKLCPKADTTNESTFYTIPFNGPGLPTDFAKFFIFLRDVSSGSSVDMKILNPNGTTYSSWNYTFTSNFNVCYAGWSKHLPVMPGVCTFQATYNGIICAQKFTVSTSNEISKRDEILKIEIYPNPATDYLTLENMGKGIVEIYNTAGQLMKMIQTEGNQTSIDISDLSIGVYSIIVKTQKGVSCSKCVKN
jgi:hypothetical protein